MAAGAGLAAGCARREALVDGKVPRAVHLDDIASPKGVVVQFIAVADVDHRRSGRGDPLANPGGGPGTSSETMNYLLYLEAFSFYDMGYASAIVVLFLFVIMLLGVDREESLGDPVRIQRPLAIALGGVAFLLLVGVMLWVFYQAHPFQIPLPEGRPGIKSFDFIFPIFMITEVPHILKGFLIVAILSAAMSLVKRRTASNLSLAIL